MQHFGKIKIQKKSEKLVLKSDITGNISLLKCVKFLKSPNISQNEILRCMHWTIIMQINDCTIMRCYPCEHTSTEATCLCHATYTTQRDHTALEAWDERNTVWRNAIHCMKHLNQGLHHYKVNVLDVLLMCCEKKCMGVFCSSEPWQDWQDFAPKTILASCEQISHVQIVNTEKPALCSVCGKSSGSWNCDYDITRQKPLSDRALWPTENRFIVLTQQLCRINHLVPNRCTLSTPRPSSKFCIRFAFPSRSFQLLLKSSRYSRWHEQLSFFRWAGSRQQAFMTPA